MKVLVFTADANTLCYHRADLIRAMVATGAEIVTAAAGDPERADKFLSSIGGRHLSVRMARSSLSIMRDLETISDFQLIIRTERPDVLFAYTIKSVLYGCILGRLHGVRKIYALLPGLGVAFEPPKTFKQRLVSTVAHTLYSIALRCTHAIFLQNRDDEALLRELHILPKRTPVHVVAGSGVNLESFPPSDVQDDAAVNAGRIRFMLMSRLLQSKGVRVFAEAARLIKQSHPQAEFHLVGPFDPNPDRIDESEVRQWTDDGVIIHHGMVKDVAALLKAMDVFVLPTWYREGVPHSTLEALSTGRAVITTDAPGARETVRLTAAGNEQRTRQEALMEGLNGFLVRPRDSAALAAAMLRYLEQPRLLHSHGIASRYLAENVFDVRKVNAVMLREMGFEKTRGDSPLEPKPSVAVAV